MKIKHLEPGRLFQFTRQNGPAIHEVVDPVMSSYRTVGWFHNASAVALAEPRGPYGENDRDVKPVSDYAAAQVKGQRQENEQDAVDGSCGRGGAP